MKLTVPSARRIRTGARSLMTVQIPPEYEAGYAEIIRQCSKDDMIRLEISKPKKSRTTGERSQNHHINGHIQQICMETGNDFEDVKLAAKRRAFKRGLPYKTKPNGEVVYSMIDGEPVPVSEADMSTVEAGYLIDELHQIAAELDIVLRENTTG